MGAKSLGRAGVCVQENGFTLMCEQICLWAKICLQIPEPMSFLSHLHPGGQLGKCTQAWGGACRGV